MLLPPPLFDSSSPGFVMKGMHAVELTFYIPIGTSKAQFKKIPYTINRGPQSEPRKTGTLASRASFTDQSPHRKESSGKKKKKLTFDTIGAPILKGTLNQN